MPTTDQSLRHQLAALLKGGQAHATFDDAVKAFPAKLRATVPENLPYSAWQLVEHLRIAQRDILDFSRNQSLPDSPSRASGIRTTNPGYPMASALGKPQAYKPMNWPVDYWPKSPTPPSATAWTESLAAIHAVLDTFQKLIKTEALHTPFAWDDGSQSGEGKTLLRSALLIADHSAYHVGELIVLRRLLGCWKK